MMVTTQGEDLHDLRRGQGAAGRDDLPALRVRNAMLPQVTALALALGQIVSGAVLVEVIFGYPGHRHAAVPGDPRGSTTS